MNGDGDEAEVSGKKASVSRPDERPVVRGYVVWPASDANTLTAQRSLVQEIAARNALSRPGW